MTLTELLSVMAGLAGLIAGLGAFLKSHSEIRKSDADAKHLAVDTANDAVAIMRQVYGDRIETHEARIEAMELVAAADRQTIIDLNRRLGNVMQAAETQSQQIQLLRERVDELLCILRENKIPLPDWANKNECDK